MRNILKINKFKSMTLKLLMSHLDHWDILDIDFVHYILVIIEIQVREQTYVQKPLTYMVELIIWGNSHIQ